MNAVLDENFFVKLLVMYAQISQEGKRERGKKRWKEQEKKGNKEGEKGFGIELGGIQGKRKELCTKKRSA